MECSLSAIYFNFFLVLYLSSPQAVSPQAGLLCSLGLSCHSSPRLYHRSTGQCDQKIQEESEAKDGKEMRDGKQGNNFKIQRFILTQKREMILPSRWNAQTMLITVFTEEHRTSFPRGSFCLSAHADQP